MQRPWTPVAGLLLGLGLLLSARPAAAVIPQAFPLTVVLKRQQYILVAKVEKVYPDKPAMMLKVDEVLKGKPPFEKLPINLTGSDHAQKEAQTPKLLKRVAEGTALVVFATKGEEQYIGFCYVNGTWFQMLGKEEGNPAKLTWAFQQFEPVLRQTFKGSTEEMRQTIIDGLAGKKEPPPVDLKEKPGIGPELPAEKPKEKSQGRVRAGGGLFAVIPTVAIGGPLAILAMLFPSLFGKPKEILNRWLALLTVASINSTLYLLRFLFADSIREYWWGRPVTVWVTMGVVTFLGVVWAWRRHRTALRDGRAEALVPAKGEEIVFRWMSIAGLVTVAYCVGSGTLLVPPWLELLPMWVVIWAGTLGVIFLRSRSQRSPAVQPRLPLEGVMLIALGFACFGLGAATLPKGTAGPVADDVEQADRYKVAWEFAPKGTSMIDSTPLVTEDCVFVAVSTNPTGFGFKGKLYCLDRATHQEKWSFDNGGKMKQVFCSPCLADGKLYIGEGYHEDNDCNIYCLDAKTGKSAWEKPFITKSHTESTPCVVDGRLYFGAGDDGLYCLNAATGESLWNVGRMGGPGAMHIDANPAVVNGRVYGGSGYGERYWYFCLDAATGAEVWPRQASELPIFGSPTVLGKQVIFGSGNGNMTASAEHPAGAVLCVNADTGKLAWPAFKVSDAVHTKPAADDRHVYFGSRDGHLYCVGRDDGKEVWKVKFNGPVVASPTLIDCPCCKRGMTVYAAGSDGRLACVDPDSGKEIWSYTVPAGSDGGKREVISSPRVFIDKTGRRQVYLGVVFGDRLQGDISTKLLCLEDLYPWPNLKPHAADRTGFEVNNSRVIP